jgi:anti-sigma regulatory factor (Ser/Thr protein kinase)
MMYAQHEGCVGPEAGTARGSSDSLAELRLAWRPGSATLARHVVTLLAVNWDAREVADTAALLVTEVVTNALLHAEASGKDEPYIGLRVAGDGPYLRVEISDPDPAHRPRTQAAGPDDECGRGWSLVTMLADAYGVTRIPGGKTVWFACHAWPHRS